MQDLSTQNPSAVEAGIIDVHTHAFVPSYQHLLGELGYSLPDFGSAPAANLSRPTAPHQISPAALDDDVSLARRIGLMDEAGVKRQILSTTFAPYFESRSSAEAAARHINDAHAVIARKHPDRLSAFVALPLPHVEASLSELERGFDQLGMVGVAIQCACLGRSVADAAFDPIYAELDRRRAVLFFHPCIDGLCSPAVNDWGLAGTAGTLFEDTVVALHLIIRQIPRRYPNIKVIIPHFGGAMPMLLDRLDNQMALSIPDLPEPPSVTARRFWYDSVGHGSPAACRCAIEAFGDRKILPGSDYPILLAFEQYRETFDYIRRLGLPDQTVDRILYRNARDVFADQFAEQGVWAGG